MPKRPADSILIVGAGISGLTLAVALARHGAHPTVVEISPRSDVLGVGISLTGPTLRALASVGLRDACIAAAFGFSEIPIFDARGNALDCVKLPSLNGPGCPGMVAIERSALHQILLREAQRSGVAIRFGTSVDAFSETEAGIDVTFSDRTSATFDFVVGADGLHSRVRSLAFPEAPVPRFTGVAVWRVTIPRPPEVTSMQLFYGPRNKAGLNPVSQDAMFLFLVEVVSNKSHIAADQLAGRLSGQLRDYEGVLSQVRKQIKPTDNIDYRPMDSVFIPSPWHRGRVVLIGDAAHTTTPHLATGAGIAIEDAVVLAELLASDQQIPDVLDGFMKRRYERCRLVVETALQLAEWEKDPGIPPQQHIERMKRTFAALAQPI